MNLPGVSNILICDRRGDQLAAYLTTHRPDLRCRVRTNGTVHAADRLWADALVGFTAPVDLEGSSIRWVHSTGAGVDGLLGRPWPAGVALTRTVGGLGERMGEYCVGHALAHAQRILAFHRDQTRRRWAPVEPATLNGTRAVVVGTGSVGTAIAARFRALGCAAIGVSRSGRARSAFDQVHPVGDLTAIVPSLRWVVIAAPLTADTRGLISGPVLDRCRGAFLINVARGALVDTAALLAALDAGTLAGAALDVFEKEPLGPDSPLWTAAGVLITPHVAGVTHVAEAGDAFLDALAARETGATPTTTVDPTRGY